MASSSSSSSSNKINQDKIQKAVKALLKWKELQIQSQKQEDDVDDDDDDFMYLCLTLNKIPPKQDTKMMMIPHRINLTHPLHTLESQPNICLIIGDGPKKLSSSSSSSASNQRLTIEAAQKKIKLEDLPINMVIKLSKLKSDYSTFEAKRKLFDSFDMFLVDKRVVHLLPKVLGKQFYKKKRKVPVPVDLKSNGGSWKGEVEKAFSSGLLSFGSGTCCVVKIGRWGLMESSQIVDNVLAAVDGIVEVVPKKWAGVRAFHLKFSESLALPIYHLKSED